MDDASLRLLLIADDPDDAIFVRDALACDRFVHYVITLARCLDEGLTMIAQAPFDAILLELELSDSQGLDTFRRLYEAAGDIPIVVLSNSVDEDLAHRAMQAGAQDHVVKGQAGCEAVARAVRYAVERRQAQARLHANEKYWRTLRQMRALVSSVDDIVFEVDEEGVYRNVWTSDDSLLYRPRAEIIGKRFDEIFGAEASRPFFEFLERVFSSNTAQVLEYSLEVDGEVRWFAARYNPIRGQEETRRSVAILVRDITERKLAEARQHRSEALLAEAQRIGRIGYLEWTESSSGLACSDEFYRILGLTPDVEITKETISSMLAPEERRRLERLDREAFARRGSTDYVYRIRRADGSERWLHQQGSITYDEHGAPIRMLAICQDVTEQRLTEMELSQSRSHLQAMLDAIPDLMFHLDRQGVFLDYKAEAHDLHAQDQPSLVGLRNRDIAPVEFADLIEQKIDDTLATGELQTFEYQLPIPGMGVQEYEARMSPCGADEVIAIVRNITESNQARQALRESQQRLKGVIDSAMDAIITLDGEMRVVMFNRAAERMFGISAEEALGQSIDRFVPSRFLGMHEEYLAHSERDYSLNPIDHIIAIVGRRSNGEEFPAESSISVVETGDGLLFTAILRDVTDRKRAEDALRQSHETAQAILNAATESVFLMDLDGTVVAANQTTARRLGTTVPDLIGRSIYDFIPVAVGESRKQQVQKVLEGGKPTLFEDERFGAWIENSIYPITDSGGRVSRLAIYGRDITARKQTEKELRESEERFRSLFRDSQAVMLMIDPDSGAILDANQAAVSYYGYSSERLTTMKMDEINQLAPEAVAMERQRAAAQTRNYFIFPHRLASGEIRTVEVYSHPIKTPAGVILYSIIFDSTERRRAEALVYAQRDLARSIGAFESIEDAFRLILDTILNVTGMDSGGIYLFDPGMERMDLAYQQGLGTEFAQAVASFPIDSANVQAILSGRAFYFAGDDPVLQNPAHQHEKLRALAVAPIFSQNRVIGCLNLASHALDEAPSFARPALETLAVEVGNVILHLQSQASLRISEESFRQIADTINEVFWIFDNRQRRLVYLNPAYARVWGVSIEDTYQDVQKYIQAIHPEDRPIMAAALERQAQGERTEMEYRVVHPDGAIHWIFDRSFPILDEDGQVIRTTGVATDITKRKQAESFLRQSEEKYRSLAEASDAIIVLLDAEGRVLYLNERALAYRDTEIDVQHALGRTLWELLPQPIADLYHARIRKVLTQAQSMVLEAPAGDSYYRVSIQPIHDELGRVTVAMLSAIDITALKAAQQELLELNRSLEERVRQRTAEVQDLYDNAPTGYHSLDADGRLLMINQTEANWLGYTREELIGRRFADFFTPDSLETFKANFPSFLQRGWVRDIEFDLVRRDGSTFPVLVSATAVTDAAGNYLMSRSTVFDNTERKQVEQALRESEEQNRLLVENSPDAIVLFDATGQIVRANRSFELLSGLLNGQGIGSTIDALGLLPADQVSRLAGAVLESLDRANEFAAVEFRLQRRDGEMRDVGVRVFGMQLHGTQHFLASMHDVTAEKQAGETLRHANAEMARALRMKDEFLANMSHELRTPLHGILAMSETLQEQIRGPLNERQHKAVRQIENSGRHLLELINDLLDLSKIEAGKLELDLGPAPVDDVCQASLQFVREMAFRKSIQMGYANALPGAQMVVDARRLKQMLVNLLSNAVKFTPEGGQVSLIVALDPGATLIHFAVQDTGPGITPADQARLFQPFTQLDSRLSRQYEGTGLGLALVKRLAEQHGGTVRLDSAGIPGQGSRFTITLPYAPPAEEAPAGAGAEPAGDLSAPASGSGLLLLLVEDNEVNIEVVEGFLTHAGHRVVVARTGVEALDIAQTITPDLILMDVHLPVLDGLEVTRRLRGQARFAATPIIALTAAAMTGDRERCLAAGATDYLSKPLRLKDLLEMIKTQTEPRRP